jgi:hypothetical protein
MKVVKTGLRNKMDDDFFANSLLLYIEMKIAGSFNLDLIFEDFVSLRHYKLQF